MIIFTNIIPSVFLFSFLSSLLQAQWQHLRSRARWYWSESATERGGRGDIRVRQLLKAWHPSEPMRHSYPVWRQLGGDLVWLWVPKSTKRVKWYAYLIIHLHLADLLFSVVSERSLEFKAKPQGYWTSPEGRNARRLFEGIAKRRGLDPLSAETWYSLARHELESEKVDLASHPRTSPPLSLPYLHCNYAS